MARRSQGRAKILFWGTLLLACFLGWRLYQIQILQGPALAAKALSQQSAVFRVSGQRGPVLTHDGVLLARSLPSRSVYASRSAVVDLAATSQRVAAILHLKPEFVQARIREAP